MVSAYFAYCETKRILEEKAEVQEYINKIEGLIFDAIEDGKFYTKFNITKDNSKFIIGKNNLINRIIKILQEAGYSASLNTDYTLLEEKEESYINISWSSVDD